MACASERVQAREDVLPGNHVGRTITDSKWIRIQLRSWFGDPKATRSAESLKAVADFPLDGLHFYCDTLDLTRPFHSPYPASQCVGSGGRERETSECCVTDNRSVVSLPPHPPLARYDEEFCFNEWLATPFAVAGLRDWCVVLLQGLCITRLVHFDSLSRSPSSCTPRTHPLRCPGSLTRRCGSGGGWQWE